MTKKDPVKQSRFAKKWGMYVVAPAMAAVIIYMAVTWL